MDPEATKEQPMPPGPGVDISEVGWGFARTRLLLTGLELKVFTHIANGKTRAHEVAQAAGASNRGMRILLDGLLAVGLLTKTEGEYGLTEEAEQQLVEGAPGYREGHVEHLEHLWQGWSRLTEAVKLGHRPTDPLPEPGEAPVEEEEASWSVAESIFPVSYRGGQILADRLQIGRSLTGLNVIDVGAGTCAYSIPIAQRDAGSKVTAVDFPQVLPVAQAYTGRHRVTDQYDYLAGDIRTLDLGKDKYDLAICANICHSEGAANTRRLFAKLFAALARDGRIVIVDMMPNDERTGPPYPLLFAVNMLVMTQEGDAFTLDEYATWLQEVGFRPPTTLDNPEGSPFILAQK
ncbi:MAG: methyltransferase [Armatimonadota bacterium]